MNKKRVYELAKELNLTSKKLIKELNNLDINVTSHMSTIENEEAKIIKDIFSDSNDNSNNDETNNKKQNKKVKEQNTDTEEKKNIIQISDKIIVNKLAEKLKVNSTEIISKLMGLGIMANINQELDYDTASLVAEELGFEIQNESTNECNEDVNELKDKLDFEDDPKDLIPRAPIVTVMGHVDHGKTSLLDSIRKTHVIDNEAGGITQHIGASVVTINDKEIVFLDTPGHEAFTSMRARGAQVTDIAILVVAADDGVMPQTIEAINHAKAAEVPIIVAVNKIDKLEANPERVKQELTEHGLVPEEWGGETICVPVSALKEQGIDELLEMITLVAEMEELKANPNRNAIGTIIEAELDKTRGTVATVLVQKGTLKIGNSIVSGKACGKVRAMIDDKGKRVKSAGPSKPVEILGLNEVPEAGEKIYVVNSEKESKEIAQNKKDESRMEKLKKSQKVSLDDLFDQINQGEVKDLNIIIKADVKGSIEAIKQSLEKLSNEEVKVNPIHGGVGAITESDIMLASASNAIVIGFNVRPTSSAMNVAESEDVDVRTYRVIYNAIEDIESAINGMLEPEYQEVIQGRMKVRATFKVPNVGVVAGIYVTQGKVTRNSKVRLLRDNIVIKDGEISSLKRYKDDVKEVLEGYEGGLGIENYNDIKEGDVIEAYTIEEIER